MTDQEIERLEALRGEIRLHNYRYHVLDDPIISDYQFDQLMNELRKIETEHPEWITPDSPTQRVGSQPLERFEKIRHPAPILSLSNAFGADDLQAWYERLLRLDKPTHRPPQRDRVRVVIDVSDPEQKLNESTQSQFLGDLILKGFLFEHLGHRVDRNHLLANSQEHSLESATGFYKRCNIALVAGDNQPTAMLISLLNDALYGFLSETFRKNIFLIVEMANIPTGNARNLHAFGRETIPASLGVAVRPSYPFGQLLLRFIS